MTEERQRRIRNALWGLFAGDALAMPAHWFYSLENVRKTFDGGLTGYQSAPHPHPESFMVGMSYQPDIETAAALGRPYDILHEHARFYDTSYSKLAIDRDERESEHGNAAPRLEDRYHYHHGLEAGENTTGAQLVRVLLRSVARIGRYDEEAFLDDFIAFLSSPGNRRDPYLEIYLRCWFENYTRGRPAHGAAERQRRIWSIGSHGGMIRSLVLSLLGETDYLALGMAIEHQNLTHRSGNVAAALGITVTLLHDLLRGEDPREASVRRAASLRTPRVTGEVLFQTYRDHRGPGNIPSLTMWELHTRLSEEPFDLEELARLPVEDVVLKRLGTACYPEHGLPLALYFAARCNFDVREALLANANAGGDNVHRNAVLGLLVGAAQEEISKDLRAGLREGEAIGQEIDAFVEVAAAGGAW